MKDDEVQELGFIRVKLAAARFDLENQNYGSARAGLEAIEKQLGQLYSQMRGEQLLRQDRAEKRRAKKYQGG
jgi:hypothetical protein